MPKTIEFNTKIETTPPRVEMGFFFSPLQVEDVRKRLEDMGYRPVFYEKPFTQ